MRSTVIVATAAFFCISSELARDLTFEDRVRVQAAIERVYFAHQIGATGPFEEAVPRAAIERKVFTYLDREAAPVAAGHTPITAEMLQREVRRIASSTREDDRVGRNRASTVRVVCVRAVGRCLRSGGRRCGLSATVAGDLVVPVAGQASFSLVTGVTAGVEGSLGSASAGPWVNSNPCP